MASDPTNLIPDRGKKLHDTYVEKFNDPDFNVVRGFEVSSRDYQLKLARRVLEEIKERIKDKKRVILYVGKIELTIYGERTKEEIKEIKEKFKQKLNENNRKR